MDYNKINIKTQYKLSDNKSITISQLTSNHYDKSLMFFTNIPEEFRRYLRSDVTSTSHIKNRIKESESNQLIRRVVEDENYIVADYSLEISKHSWKYGEGYLRILMFPKYNDTDLKYKIAKDIKRISKDLHLHRLIVKIMSPQAKMQQIYESLGFKVTGILFDYVKDQLGEEQNFVVLIASLDEIKIK